MPLVVLLGAARERVPAYGSGGFTSYTLAKLREQLSGWVNAGLPAVKMKIGREPQADLGRVRSAREAIGDTAGLFVDANGAYSRQAARLHAEAFGDFGVRWFEEPVSSDDLDGLSWLRALCPAGMEIAAGEYGYDVRYFRRMCAAGAVDVLQADATRCGGVTGFLRAAAIADAFQLPLSSHCAPSMHVHVACAAPRMRHYARRVGGHDSGRRRVQLPRTNPAGLRARARPHRRASRGHSQSGLMIDRLR
jgi:L-alanine-DL-glutamate epimerase-like enolase superfamily enzyme